MIKSVTPKRMREIEEHAINNIGIPGLVLMEHAAIGLVRAYQQAFGDKQALVICGPGNNGGDGLAFARLYAAKGGSVRVVLLCEDVALSGDAQMNLHLAYNMGVTIEHALPNSFENGVIVDAIFGTGLSRAPQGVYEKAIEWINAQGVQVLAVDIPSGVNAQNGLTEGCAVRAAQTVTFGYPKIGHYLFPGRELSGEITLCDIGLGNHIPPDGPVILQECDVQGLIAPRQRNTHKGTYGHALILAGSRGMAGAASLCALGALRAGAGLVSCGLCETSVMPILQVRNPEAVAYPLLEEDGALAEQDITHLFTGKAAIAIGPGMRNTPATAALAEQVLASGISCVLDADALNAYAGRYLRAHGNVVLTPHPGEMARLIGEVVTKPLAQAAAVAKKTGAVVLLKGATTVIAAADGRTALNIYGTSGMATGGSGDVLSGVIASLMAQGLQAFDAACAGAYLHAKAGEEAAKSAGIAPMTALDIANGLKDAFLAIGR